MLFPPVGRGTSERHGACSALCSLPAFAAEVEGREVRAACSSFSCKCPGWIVSDLPLNVHLSSSLNLGVLVFHHCKQVQKQLSKAENPLICDTLTSLCLLLILNYVLNNHGLHIVYFSENICKAISQQGLTFCSQQSVVCLQVNHLHVLV